MKIVTKILSSLLLTIILVSLFVIPASADENLLITASEGLNEITIDGDKYIKADVSGLYNDARVYTRITNLTLGKGLENYHSATVVSDFEDMLSVNVTFTEKTGATYSANYVHSNAYEAFQTLYEIKTPETYKIFLGGSVTNIDASLLRAEIEKGEKLTIDNDYYYDYYTVCTEYRRMYKISGYIVETDFDLYYMPIIEKEGEYTEYNVHSYNELEVYKITDETLINQLSQRSDSSNGYAIFFISLLVLVFIIIPLVLLILSIIFSIKTKGIYKKLWIAVLILSALLLISIVLILALSVI